MKAATRPAPPWQPWLVAIRGLPDNPLPHYLQRLEARARRRALTLPALLSTAGLAGGALLAAWLLPRFAPGWQWPPVMTPAMLVAALLFPVLLPVVRTALGLLGLPGTRGRLASPLELDELLASSPLTDIEVLVGTLRCLWPRLVLVSALLALLVCAWQVKQVSLQQGVMSMRSYPQQVRPAMRQALEALVREPRSPRGLLFGLLELGTGGTDPALRFKWGLPLTYAGMVVCGALATLGWLGLLIACGRDLASTALVPATAVGSVLTQLGLFSLLALDWQQRVDAAYTAPLAPDWLLTSLALCVVAAVLSLQLLPAAPLWRAAVACGAPLLLALAIPWSVGQGLAASPAGNMSELQLALASSFSGLQLALGSGALVNPVAAPLPLYGGIAPGGLFTPPLWHWLSWPLLLGVQFLLTAVQLGQARLAIALHRGAALE